MRTTLTPAEVPMPNRIAVVGSYNHDLVFSVDHLPHPGQTVSGDMQSHHGGKGFNQAIAAARLGAATQFIGSVGNDDAGDAAMEYAQATGMQWSVERSDRPTGTASVVVDQKGENQIVVAPGANATLRPSAIVTALDKNVSVVITQMETSKAAVEAVARWAQGQAISILNPAPVTSWLDAKLWSAFDILTPNEHELTEMLARTGYRAPYMNDPASVHAACRALNVEQVIVTLGRNGALLSQPDRFALLPAVQVRAIDTTGAGDCFNGALAAGLCRNMPIADCIALANRAAALSVTRNGAATSMPRLEELNA